MQGTPDPKATAREFSSEDAIEWQPTEPAFAAPAGNDPSFGLDLGLDGVELLTEDMDAHLLRLSASQAMRPTTEAEQKARDLGMAARRAGCLPDASPYKACSELDLVWLDGYRSAS